MSTHMKNSRSLALWMVAGAVIISLTTATSLSAQGTLSGCYVPNSGTVYRIKAAGLPDACRSKQHVEFTWSLQGPPGPAGPTGPIGPQGPTGPAGGVTTSGVETVLKAVSISPGGVNFEYATCPAGKIATGGGFEFLTAQLTAIASRPVNATTWQVSLANSAATTGAGNAFVVCVPGQ